MNFAMIGYVLGWVFNFEAVFLLLPALVGLVYREPAGWGFLLTAGICLLCGVALVLHKPRSRTLYAKEGYVIVSLSWIGMSLFGALPFVLSGLLPNFIDALFESVSGFTTTGATVFQTVEDLPQSCLLWRSFSQWIGGMGVLVFIMAFLPLSGAGNMNLMRAESPGPMVGKLVPRVRTTAMLLYAMYLGMTFLEWIFLLIAGMPALDAVNIACSTAGTGGFGIKNDSMASYSAAIQGIVTAFMILFGVNFNLYFLLLRRRFREALKTTEVWVYFLIVLVSTLTIAYNIRHLFGSTQETLLHSAFTVGSVMTTTGFSTFDFNLWPELSRTILVMLMLIGACAGSTGGGIKVSRIMMLVKIMRQEIRLQIHPRQVQKIKMGGREIASETVRSLNAYVVVYVLLFAGSVLLVSFDNHDLITNFTAVAATINNIGPGLELSGPTSNFAFFSQPTKIVLILDMLAGRLELFPLLLLVSPVTWKR